ncbi:MAG TPA: FAD-dependent thymidylate synthase, partial [Terriglobales bacterium]|nr:FAD-dependent thymidylate synthase [Terriglobales bacterium]
MVSVEQFTADERRALAPYFTNLDGPIFALRGLPEVVKGALFARYSRSPKSLRRLFLDEFLDQVGDTTVAAEVGVARADRLYERVFSDYGDDSVAQLGGAHIACEGASNILTKVLEWGRLMAYLEQSTRYISYTDRSGDRWKYLVPAEIASGPLEASYRRCLDQAFATYAAWLPRLDELYQARYPKAAADSEAVYRRTIRAKSLDTLRGLLPAATRSSLGLFGTGQAFEALLLRLRAHPLREARECGEQMLIELRHVIPAFLKRVDVEERGLRWSGYLEQCARATERLTSALIGSESEDAAEEVTLVEFDPEGETKVVAAALYAGSHLPDRQLLELARRMSSDDRAALLQAYVGERSNRRHRPG